MENLDSILSGEPMVSSDSIDSKDWGFHQWYAYFRCFGAGKELARWLALEVHNPVELP